MSWSLLIIICIILIALVFDYINGFHDAANSIATVVSTRVLTPMQAVAWAAFFNFVAAFGFGVQVARTVGKGVVEAGVVDQWVILGALCGAITWNLITWYYGIPSSSSHALIGGFAGAAVAKAGFGALLPSGLSRSSSFIVLAPVIGLCLGFTLMVGTLWAVRGIRPSRVDGLFRRLQLLSAARYSLGHGPTTRRRRWASSSILLFSAGYLGSEFYVPFWVILAAHAAIGLGTLAGGWRIVKTMGMQAHQAAPDRGVLRRDRGGGDADRYRDRRDSRQHHPHHHRLDHGGGRHPAALRRALGRGRGVSSGRGCSRSRSPASSPPRSGGPPPSSSPAGMSATRSRAGLLAASLGLWLLVPFGWLLAHLPLGGGPGGRPAPGGSPLVGAPAPAGGGAGQPPARASAGRDHPPRSGASGAGRSSTSA